jgi:hypothetical protein
VLCAESVREGRPREQGQKGWRIDLSSREKDRQECEEEKKQQGEEKKGREETTRTSSGHAAAVSCRFVRSSYLAPLLLSSPTLPIINTRISTNPLPLNPQRRPS